MDALFMNLMEAIHMENFEAVSRICGEYELDGNHPIPPSIDFLPDPLFYACMNGNESIAFYLLSRFKNVEKLHVAAMAIKSFSFPNRLFLGELIERVGRNWKAKDGRSWLHLTVSGLNMDPKDSDAKLEARIKFVLDNGVSPLLLDLAGNSILHWIAVVRNVPKATGALKGLGIPYTHRNNHKNTPYDVAKKKGNTVLADFIEKIHKENMRSLDDFQLVNLFCPRHKRLSPADIRLVSDYLFVF